MRGPAFLPTELDPVFATECHRPADRRGRASPVRQGQPIPPGPPKYMKVPHVVGELFAT